MPVTFRPALEDDIGTICSLAHKIWHEHYPGMITVEQIDFMLNAWNSEKAVKQQMQAGVQFFLAYLNSEAVAYAGIQLKEEHNFLNKFYVDTAKHRGGIGTEFFRYLLNQMDASKPVRLQVNRQNIKAINFYFKLGFVIELAADFDIGGGYYMNDFVMMRKPR